MAHQEAGAHAHRTADDEYVATPGSSYEHTDANVWAIVKFGVWLVVMALVVHVGMGLMWAMLIERSKDTSEQRYPLATAEPQQPPAPRLQQYPQNDMEDFRAAERAELQGYGWVDKEAGVVRIPIAEAMRLTVERGLPARAADPEQPAPTPGLMGSDASSGRLMERRRQ